MTRALLALLLSGCTTTQAAGPARNEPVHVPLELRLCPRPPSAVPLPRQPRTFDSVVEWAKLTEAAREQTVAALETCRERLDRVVGLVERGQ